MYFPHEVRILLSFPRESRAVGKGFGSEVDFPKRADHTQTYARFALERGLCPVWWDNGPKGSGGYGLLNRGATPAQFTQSMRSLGGEDMSCSAVSDLYLGPHEKRWGGRRI